MTFHGVPWQRFMEFISPDAPRFSIIKELLEGAALEYRIVEMAGGRHFFMTSPLNRPAQSIPPVVLVAHYDRAEGSQGANDNSVGVFLLIETAIKLKKSKANNWTIVFTDKEELKPGESIQAQGSFVLSRGLKNSSLGNSRIFCFDTCGVGDTLLVSTTLEYLLKKEDKSKKMRESLLELRKIALDTARDLGMTKVLLAPTPFSDDAGFFRSKVAAQTVTMLPSGECIQLVAELRKNPQFAEVLINAELRKKNRLSSIPETWRGLNSPNDSYLRLTPKHFRTVVNFAEALCRG
jgi:hypothetical protein